MIKNKLHNTEEGQKEIIKMAINNKKIMSSKNIQWIGTVHLCSKEYVMRPA